jgi:hypothetical protein
LFFIQLLVSFNSVEPSDHFNAKIYENIQVLKKLAISVRKVKISIGYLQILISAGVFHVAARGQRAHHPSEVYLLSVFSCLLPSPMPPKLKSGPTVSQKRKSHLANAPAKRPKTDDSSARPTTPKKSTVATSPRTPKKTVISLATKVPSLPDEAYFHPTAVKLFDQVTVYSIISSSNILDN